MQTIHHRFIVVVESEIDAMGKPDELGEIVKSVVAQNNVSQELVIERENGQVLHLSLRTASVAGSEVIFA